MSDAAEPTSGRAAAGWGRLFEQLFDPHPSHVALVALDGTVLAVNAAWRRYGAENGATGDTVGQNYLAACEAGVAAGYPGAREAYIGLLDVMRNNRPKFTMVYPCHTPARREWYRMWVEPQSPSVPAVIVAHQLVETQPHDGPTHFGVGPATFGPADRPVSDASDGVPAGGPRPL